MLKSPTSSSRLQLHSLEINRHEHDLRSMSDTTSLIASIDSLLRIGPHDMIERTIREQPFLFKDQTQYRRTLKMVIGKQYQDQIERLESHKNERSPPITQTELEKCTRFQGELRKRWIAVMAMIDDPEYSDMIIELIQKTKATKLHG